MQFLLYQLSGTQSQKLIVPKHFHQYLVTVKCIQTMWTNVNTVHGIKGFHHLLFNDLSKRGMLK